MHFTNTYTTVDTHTAGEPLRIVTAGIPNIPGETILAKRQWVKNNLDHVRTALMYEPRGHADMYGCYMTPPVTEAADFGVIFMHNEGYSSMCGHGIIALATVAVAQRLVTPVIPETRIGIDTPAGFVEAFVTWDGSKVGDVRFLNVPSFVYRQNLTVDTLSFGQLTVNVAYGGAFYAYLEAEQTNLRVVPRDLAQLVQLGDEVKHAVEAVLKVVHPLEPELCGIYGTIIHEAYDPSGMIVPTPRGTYDLHQRNVCVFAKREVDRSPTGTGTAGRVALLHAQGNLRPGEVLANSSILGTTFLGKVVETQNVEAYSAVVPEVSGRASITGFCQWVIEEDDPVADGFLLR
ncbi:MAG: proline racemase family protein [Deinococcota bacterium]